MVISVLCRHKEALEHAHIALQLVDFREDGTGRADGEYSLISVRAVAYYNMSVQLEVR
eukprot:SAG11_NODE_2983_length_2792_cov_1.531006_2_plen_58_part_00